MIKLFDPTIDKKEETALISTLKSRFWASGSGIGNVQKFEDKFRKYINSSSCVAVNSGTAALHLSLSLQDISNFEVILPSLSFVSTAHAIVLNGGKPVFVDIDEKTMCIDPKKIEEVITNRTKAVLPVHFGGMPCNLTRIRKICKKNNLLLVEDAAHAAGASYKNQKIGAHGDLVCFSFHPVKNLAMPSGGLIAINGKDHKKISDVLRSKRWCGISNRSGPNYNVDKIGWNYYMNEFSAAIGLIQLKKLHRLNKIRKSIANHYTKEINLEEKMPYDPDCSYHLYWIRVKNRKEFMKKMKENGIETGIHYRPIHQLSLYKRKKHLPLTEKIGKEIVSIPIHPNLDEGDIRKIIKYVNKFAK